MFLLTVNYGCTDRGEPPIFKNNPPRITGIFVTDDTVFSGDTSRLNCYATDDDNNPLYYIWTASEGEFLEGKYSPSALWMAPQNRSLVEFIVTVTDNIDKTSKNTFISVILKPFLKISPTNLDFGENSSTASVSLQNLGDVPLNWSIKEKPLWVNCTPDKGIISSTTVYLTVEVLRELVGAGEFVDSIVFQSDVNSPVLIIKMKKEQYAKPKLKIFPKNLDFGLEEDSLAVFIKNEGTGILEWFIAKSPIWVLRIHPANGEIESLENDSVSIIINRQSLNPGEYTGKIEFDSNGGTDTVTISAQQTGIELSHNELFFTDRDTFAGITVANKGPLTLNWTSRWKSTWLFVEPLSGVLNPYQSQNINVYVRTFAYKWGDYKDVLNIETEKNVASVKVNFKNRRLVEGIWWAKTVSGNRLEQMYFSVALDASNNKYVVKDPGIWMFLSCSSGTEKWGVSFNITEFVTDDMTFHFNLNDPSRNGTGYIDGYFTEVDGAYGTWSYQMDVPMVGRCRGSGEWIVEIATP